MERHPPAAGRLKTLGGGESAILKPMANSKRRPAEDPEETALKAAAVGKARASVAAGRYVENDVVLAWLKDLAEGRIRPRPRVCALVTILRIWHGAQRRDG